jgi:3-dehydroquinate synthase
MCDASIGGKTGIDLMHYKNMVGTFAFPEQIFIYPKFLKHLPLKN